MRFGDAAQVVAVLPDDEEQAWSLFQKFRGPSFTDCTTAVLMRRLRIDTIVTLDQHFKWFGFTCLP